VTGKLYLATICWILFLSAARLQHPVVAPNRSFFGFQSASATRARELIRQNTMSKRSPLRKSAGSQVCDRHGIYAASRALRHASVAVTAAHYLDKKSKVTSGLGAAFSDRIVELGRATTSA
jgi:hypothetical protein